MICDMLLHQPQLLPGMPALCSNIALTERKGADSMHCAQLHPSDDAEYMCLLSLETLQSVCYFC